MSKQSKPGEMSRHTPGPWEYSAAGAQVFANNGQTHVADVRGYGALQYEGEDAAVARMDADGALIAAAPDLLAACEKLLALAEDDRRSLVECSSQIELVNGKCSPVPGTLEPDVAEIVSEYDAAIEAARAAILKTTHPKPKEQGATQ